MLKLVAELAEVCSVLADERNETRASVGVRFESILKESCFCIDIHIICSSTPETNVHF